VVIRHNNELVSIYKSLSDNVTVEKNDVVKKGDIIGYTSDTMLDEWKEGNHVHFEVKYRNAYIDPASYFEEGDK
jgi:murein DD-endopeptidase MepM/ murein hydrolase activator NlpD